MNIFNLDLEFYFGYFKVGLGINLNVKEKKSNE